jgi:hypothetical protein
LAACNRLIAESIAQEKELSCGIVRLRFNDLVARCGKRLLGVSKHHFRMPRDQAMTDFVTLRRANQPKGGLPEDIRLVLGLDRMIHHLAAYGKAHRKPKPDAIRKRLAADYALDLCKRFGVKTTTARTGKFCLVAAALFGDPDVDLHYHCMKAISQKPAQK